MSWLALTICFTNRPMACLPLLITISYLSLFLARRMAHRKYLFDTSIPKCPHQYHMCAKGITFHCMENFLLSQPIIDFDDSAMAWLCTHRWQKVRINRKLRHAWVSWWCSQWLYPKVDSGFGVMMIIFEAFVSFFIGNATNIDGVDFAINFAVRVAIGCNLSSMSICENPESTSGRRKTQLLTKTYFGILNAEQNVRE